MPLPTNERQAKLKISCPQMTLIHPKRIQKKDHSKLRFVGPDGPDLLVYRHCKEITAAAFSPFSIFKTIRLSKVRSADLSSPRKDISNLFDSNRLGQVARLIDVEPAQAGNVIRQQLQRNDVDDRAKHPGGSRAPRAPYPPGWQPARRLQSPRPPRYRRAPWPVRSARSSSRTTDPA